MRKAFGYVLIGLSILYAIATTFSFYYVLKGMNFTTGENRTILMIIAEMLGLIIAAGILTYITINFYKWGGSLTNSKKVPIKKVILSD